MFMQAIKEGLGWLFANSWKQLFLVWLLDFHFFFQLSWVSIDFLMDIILGRGGGISFHLNLINAPPPLRLLFHTAPNQ